MAKPSRSEILVVCVATACAVVSFAVIFWKKWPDPQIFGTKGEWVGALASFAAALTAVAIAFWSHRRNTVASMMEGAFEVVAAEFVIRKAKSEATLFRLRVADSVKVLNDLDEKILAIDRKIEAAASIASPPPSAEELRDLDRWEEVYGHQRQLIIDAWARNFAPYVEPLQSQMATISHVKAAAFDPEIGLALVKAKALLRRIEGIAAVALTRTVLLENLDEILEYLVVVENGVANAERHITQMGRVH